MNPITWLKTNLLMVGLGIGASAFAAAAFILMVHLGADAARKRQLTKANAAWASWAGYGRAEKRAFDGERTARGQEAAQALADATKQDSLCRARVDAARRSAVAINTLLSKEPTREPTTGCPTRELLDAGQLRDALRPAAQSSRG